MKTIKEELECCKTTMVKYEEKFDSMTNVIKGLEDIIKSKEAQVQECFQYHQRRATNE